MIEEMSAMKPYSWRSGSAGLISINVGLDGPPTPPAVLEKHYRNHAGIWDLPPDPACNFKLAELLGLRPIRATHRNDLEDGWLGWQSFLDHHRSLMPTAFRFCRDSAHLGMLVVASAHVSDTADPLISVSDLPDGKPATSARTFAFDHVTHVGAAPVLGPEARWLANICERLQTPRRTRKQDESHTMLLGNGLLEDVRAFWIERRSMYPTCRGHHPRG
ncbi:hypothetical protein PAPYR_12655 [Paratrimastix pyriformis]|uniref:Uncharacterized protein n=1 Tax=Paratrimastix pyriformis TaxID=342808 RepID=A0ABQ8U6S9_9EUKA|nr:hypothetical protein PAPYR_12655 [Paratrimastix pyriformis]